MIVYDSNILLYAYNLLAPQHMIARTWLESVLSSSEPVVLPWPVISSFLRISTNSRAFLQPLEMKEAIDAVNAWMGCSNVIVPVPTERHWLIFSNLLAEGQVRGSMTTDAEIAAYTVENGATLYTCDRGFARFPNLKFVNPLQP